MARRAIKVFVYRNLNHNCFSVRCVKTGLVIAHTDSLLLRDVHFKVHENGRQRVIRERRKNVHAGLEGNLVLSVPYLFKLGEQPDELVRYDPYRWPTFVNSEGEAVHEAEYALLRDGRIFIPGRKVA